MRWKRPNAKQDPERKVSRSNARNMKTEKRTEGLKETSTTPLQRIDTKNCNLLKEISGLRKRDLESNELELKRINTNE